MCRPVLAPLLLYLMLFKVHYWWALTLKHPLLLAAFREARQVNQIPFQKQVFYGRAIFFTVKTGVTPSERLFSDLLRPTGTICKCCIYSLTSDSPTVSQLFFSTVINALGKYSFFSFRQAVLIWWRQSINAGWGDRPTRRCSWSLLEIRTIFDDNKNIDSLPALFFNFKLHKQF